MKKYLLSMLLASGGATAAPFDTCPSKAFLVQGNTATIYGINLASGTNTKFVDDVGTNNKVNGFGFSVHDRYLYGWDYQSGGLAKIGKDYTVQTLDVSGFPTTNFYVGDVAVLENAYYSYRRGADYGLYRVSLDELSADYLQAQKIVDGGQLNLNIFDLAFHPDENAAYSVDSNGNLHKIDVTTGLSENLGNTGVSGTFGAVYFDVEGNFYISRNSDGHIYLIDINDVSNTDLFAYGPYSKNNDGARCATAPIIDESEPPTMDFGDAPDSYSTTLNSNGARHNTGDLYFGSTVSAEYYPKDIDDDDGIGFITSLETGLDALLSINASKAGFVNAWVDWNQNGAFDDAEQILSGYNVPAGTTRLLIEVPVDAVQGETWVRFRLSEQELINSTGGVNNGEVEDFKVNVVASGVVETSTSWQTVAFEDHWPQQGDYDFNDVVVKYKAVRSQIGDQTVRFKLTGYLLAVGASYHNGMAFRFKGVNRSDINESLIRYQVNGKQVNSTPLEADRTESILIAFADTRNVVPVLSGCSYFRTQSPCSSQDIVPFEITLPLQNSYGVDVTGFDIIDPFIFGVNGFNHGEFVDAENARGWEVHLKNHDATEAFDSSYFDQGDDMSSTYGNFQNATGLPWALKVGDAWRHPQEGIDLLSAYPQFKDFAISSGLQNPTWFDSPVNNKSIEN